MSSHEPTPRLHHRDCEGLEELREALASHQEIDLVGWREQVAEAPARSRAGISRPCCTRPAARRSRRTSWRRSASTRERRSSWSPRATARRCSTRRSSRRGRRPAAARSCRRTSCFAIRKASHAGRRVTPKRPRGRVVTVFSPKGGTGKTVLATNLSAALAKNERQADAAARPRPPVRRRGDHARDRAGEDDLRPGRRAGRARLGEAGGYTTRHPCGLDVLPAPLRPEDAELVTEAKLARLLEVARASYDVIVVDTSPFFHGPMLATLDRTDDLLLVCGLDVPTLKNVRLALQTLELLSFPPEPDPGPAQPRELEGRDEPEGGRERARR